MCRQTVIRLFPAVLATLVGLACEQLPNSSAIPKGPNFSANGGTTDRITGGGKLGDGRDFATFGFNARSDQGQIEWVQHCLDGVTASPTCLLGGFNFHGSTVIAYGASPDDPAHCRAWSGTGEAKFKDPSSTSTGPFTAKACDFREPGHGADRICFTFSTYVREGVLGGGNIQLHPGEPAAALVTCPSEGDPT